ncbi:hypothetical protein HMPREF1145_1016 [Oribacterium parvum ACB8]|nr:hypothetical protein HMPREF1145_1016 [Oribacterium parvum ACB8]
MQQNYDTESLSFCQYFFGTENTSYICMSVFLYPLLRYVFPFSSPSFSCPIVLFYSILLA